MLPFVAADAPIPAWYDAVVEAHGILGALAYVIFLPLGVILLRLVPGRHTIWIHVAVQMFALALITCNAGMGIWMGLVSDQVGPQNSALRPVD